MIKIVAGQQIAMGMFPFYANSGSVTAFTLGYRGAAVSNVVDGPQRGGFGGGEAHPPTVGPSPGSGYVFDADTLAATIRRWDEILTELQEDRRLFNAASFGDVPLPAMDPPSQRYLKAYRDFLAAAAAHHTALAAYAESYLEHLRGASKAYSAQEDTTEDQLDSLDDPLRR